MKKNGSLPKPADLFVFDAHCDTASVLFDQPWAFSRNPGHLDLQKIRKGGLKAQIFAIWVDPLLAPQRAMKRALQLLQTMEQKVFQPKHAAKVTSLSEMAAALRHKKLAAWLFLEGGHIIENSPEILHIFHSLGVRGMTLTHSKNTDWADSTTDTPRANGLTALGRQIVRQMAQMGMAIDVSHASDQTIAQVLKTTSVPIMASHSNARKLCPIPRNLPDKFIREITARKGFIGANFFPAFIKRSVFDQIEENFNKFAKEIQERTAGRLDDPDFLSQVEWEYYLRAAAGNDAVEIEQLIDHIIHIASIGSIDCVGLGSDFDGIPSTPARLADAAAYPVLVAALQKRGFKEREIRKICGLNLKNFLQLVEKQGKRG
ncbi:MAG: dipeptidase [Acidobacteria bacterium]|nr:dipeptidase [Acidobacteriota bacterium]MBU4404061.1 dipeptidase [Acidobacteriota bacterium]MCG2811221.1 dipeptidase [Candidatus Aminicenantes bacterium]